MKKIFFLTLAILGLYIFRSWFGFGHLGGFDLLFFYHERLKEFQLLPRIWDSAFGDGMGDSTIKYLWTETYLRSVANIFVNRINLPWELVLRLFWFWPYLVLMIFSPYLFLKKILPDKNSIFVTAGVLVYSFNTYVLLLVSGGQLNLAIAYMLAPLALWSFIKQITDNSEQIREKIKNSIATGLVLAVQVLFDLRMTYVTMLAVGVYLVISLLVKPYTVHRILYAVISIIIAVLLHAFWLLPQIMVRSSPLPPGYDNPGWLSFLSWAPFSNTLSLLHPNWPENIFGKTYFMRPEFLIIPIIAFVSLLFINGLTSSRVKKSVLFFALLGLLGAFLAKGVNGPWGEVYYWLFSYVPFFSLFRDPTKFYLLVGLSYAVLIPLSLTFSAERISSSLRGPRRLAGDEAISKLMRLPRPSLRSGLAMTRIIIGVFILYWFILLWPVLSGQVKGTLFREKIPDEYIKLEQLLSSDKNFSRTLWVPTTHRLSYVTNTHPAIPAAKLLNTTDQDKILDFLKQASVSAELRDLAVGYVVIPYDFSGEIFLTDRKYDETLRNTVKREVDKLSYLFPISGFSHLTAYRLTGTKEHFYINNIHGLTRSRVHELMINPTEYEVQIANGRQGDILVFSERFDIGWNAQLTDSSKQITVNTNKYQLLNSFILPKDGDYTLEVYYKPQQYVVWGSYISLLTLALSLAVLLRLRIVQRRLT